MNLEISIEYEPWNAVGVDAIARDCVKTIFTELRFVQNNVEICFLFTSDEEMRLLNKTYLGVNKSTNVLSFPTNLPISLDFNDGPPGILGSLAFGHQTILQESLEQQKSFENHLKHLVVHGMLHLFGHDHGKMQDAEKMESLEKAILAQLNVPDPYQ
ncbi:MAG: rRNA maturation RNase YbeY [Holosporaceae bacterium]|jgi:probable rRNA maturation factor|nr:rRNA maturation RNase YbeY [Holosporaceae bacterium]